MKNILVTGGAGYIGSIICNYFIKKKLKVFIIDNLSRGHKNLINSKSTFFKLDINDKKKIRKIILENKIDTIIHLAALMRVDESIKYPHRYEVNNVKGTSTLIKAAKETSIKRIIFSSSCSVYGKLNKSKISEDDKTLPLSPYGNSKLKGEKILKKLCKQYKINFVILRYFNVVGAQVKNKPFLGQINKTEQLFQNIYLFMRKHRRKFFIFGTNLKTKDGTCIRDFIHVMDLAEIHYLSAKFACKKNISEIFNCGYGKGYSIKEVVKTFENVSKKKINANNAPPKKGDIVKSICNNKKILKKLKWKPKYNNLNSMVKDTIKWFDYSY